MSIKPSKLSVSYIACLVVLILIIYSNSLNVPFQWDENMHIVNEPIIKDLHYFIHPSEARGFEHYNFFISRYIPHLTFALNYSINGLSVAGYHIVNIAIHIGSAILVYLLVLLTFRTPFMSDSSLKQNSPFIALLTSLLFAAHPLQTAAVTYIMQRFASLVAFFYLLSLTAYIKSRLPDDERLESRGRYRRIFFYSMSFISAVLAMKTKENAFTLPLVITLYEFCFFDGGLKKRMLFLAPVLLTLCIIPLTLRGMTAVTGKIGSSLVDPGSYMAGFTWDYSRGEYFFTQFRVIVTYLRMLIFPVHLEPDGPYPVFKHFFEPQVMLSFIFLATLFGLGVYLVVKPKAGVHEAAKNSNKVNSPILRLLDPPSLRLVGFGILWFFITLSVESIITTPRLIEMYRVYLPSVGAIISTVTVLFLFKETMRSPKVRERIVVMIVIITGLLSVDTYLCNEAYKDKIRMGELTAKSFPVNAIVHYNLGIAYAEANMIGKAVEQNLIAIKLKPDYAEAHSNLGANYQTIGKFNKAIEQYLIAIKLKPDLAEPHFNLGVFYYSMGQTENAKEEITAGLKLAPDNPQAQQLLNKISGLH